MRMHMCVCMCMHTCTPQDIHVLVHVDPPARNVYSGATYPLHAALGRAMPPPRLPRACA